MILVETKTQTSPSSSPTTLPSQEEDSNISLTFSELLKGFKNKTDDGVIQNGALVLALQDETKSLKGDIKGADLVKLTKVEADTPLTDTPLELNPQITQNLTPSELKSLIGDAKKYLKTKIIESEGFKKSEIQALPKTLKGLVAVAKKFGLDMSKVTIQEIQADPKTLAKLEVVTVEEKITKLEKLATPQKSLENAIASQTPLDTKSKGVSKESETSTQNRVKEKTVLEVVEKESAKVQTKQLGVNKPIATSKVDQERQEAKQELQTSQRESKIADLPQKIKATPLFKAQTKVEITTEQLVNAKLSTIVEQNRPKQKADETLKMLLRGEKVSQKDTGFTADFSVTTARVIAPQATTDAKKSLESLLRGEQNDTTTASKTDGMTLPKADSFDLKLHEAKQMTKYLSQDVKTAIEDYKSPFTRIKLQLNPQRLGEVDLTIVQRGKNLHINLSSNNAAINALALNANDLKLQLTNSGINNASLNFNNSSQSSEQGSFGQQQQNSQNGRQAKEEYNYFDNEEKNEEILSSLEIVVPNYA